MHNFIGRITCVVACKISKLILASIRNIKFHNSLLKNEQTKQDKNQKEHYFLPQNRFLLFINN